ncbi:MAG: trypsin-like peptidase domain-containing protein [Anaerolineae bacterium]|nr:trypsin-like peptidase domain-containing protein [Anaerolineae bacterium]
MKLKRQLWPLLLVLLLLPALACGGGASSGNNNRTDVTQVTDTPPPPPATNTPEPEPTEVSLAVNNLQDVRKAVVQIIAQGTFRDPAEGFQYNAAGAGTGFIIDQAGIAVTNNHVVTGAAFLQVYVYGESQPRNARVLGVSECSDLAVIDIDGEGFNYLEWYVGNIDVGLDVYTAGFPLGDPEYTLTRGIVSKARANGETSWASVDYVIEHDATINPGNSGGPLVDLNGRVVGVNYAGAFRVSQYFAIARDEAIRVIDQLRQGRDVTSIGVNGTAVGNDEGLTGIWVASVKSGSPADNVGIQPGDIILSLEGLILGVDGTMADYCDILRSRHLTDVMKVKVLRFDTEQVLEGQLNGLVLEQSFSFAAAVGSEVSSSSGSSGSATSYDYTIITDSSGLLRVEVPTNWNDVDGSAWGDANDPLGVAVRAAPNLNSWRNTWSTPGVFFGASLDLLDGLSDSERREMPDAVLDLDAFDYSASCTYDGRYDYTDPVYSGKYDLWTKCGDADSLYIVLAVLPEDLSYFVLVNVLIVTEADLDALDHILDSFIVVTN